MLTNYTAKLGRKMSDNFFFDDDIRLTKHSSDNTNKIFYII